MASATDAAPRILGLFPHPDDESYAAGAALAQCAAAGCDVRLVSLTRGEAGHDRRGGAPSPEQLGRIRTAELQEACDALGIGLDGILDLPDGRLAEVPAATLEARIVGVLERRSPDVVITLGDDGVYGSIDHLVLTRSLGTVAPRFPGLTILHAAFPAGHFDRVRRRIARAGIAVDTSRRLGLHRDDVPLCVTATSQRNRKLAAVAAHRSQLRDGDPFSFLGGGILEPLLAEEWFTVGCGSSI